MALRTEKIKLDGTTYEIRELPVKVLLPLSTKMAEGSSEAQIELLGSCVAVDGKLLGDAAGDIGASAYMKLIQKVLLVNGMANIELGNVS